jgi:hypothetical protein
MPACRATSRFLCASRTLAVGRHVADPHGSSSEFVSPVTEGVRGFPQTLQDSTSSAPIRIPLSSLFTCSELQTASFGNPMACDVRPCSLVGRFWGTFCLPLQVIQKKWRQRVCQKRLWRSTRLYGIKIQTAVIVNCQSRAWEPHTHPGWRYSVWHKYVQGEADKSLAL